MAPTSFDDLPDSPLVSTAWLADNLDAENLVVLDATVLVVPGFNGASAYVTGDEQYLAHGHVPGAVFADLLESFSDPEGEHPFTRPDAKHFERAAAAAGIDNDTPVVVYDSAIGQWASRLWWLFRSYGYDEVRVLDGGLVKWKAEGRPLATGYVAPRGGREFFAGERPELWADKADVAAVVDGSAPGVLVCGLPPKEFTGEAGHRPRPGHIPGSHSVPAARLIDRDTNAYLPPERLTEVFGAELLGGHEPIVAYCGAAIAATSDALALAVLGRVDVRVYDGSLNEWAADASAPLVAPALASASTE